MKLKPMVVAVRVALECPLHGYEGFGCFAAHWVIKSKEAQK